MKEGEWSQLADVLGANEVLSVRGVPRDRRRDGILVPGTPRIGGKIATLVADALLEDLEPVARPIVGLHVVTGGPGHVHQAGAYSRQPYALSSG